MTNSRWTGRCSGWSLQGCGARRGMAAQADSQVPGVNSQVETGVIPREPCRGTSECSQSLSEPQFPLVSSEGAGLLQGFPPHFTSHVWTPNQSTQRPGTQTSQKRGGGMLSLDSLAWPLILSRPLGHPYKTLQDRLWGDECDKKRWAQRFLQPLLSLSCSPTR